MDNTCRRRSGPSSPNGTCPWRHGRSWAASEQVQPSSNECGRRRESKWRQSKTRAGHSKVGLVLCESRFRDRPLSLFLCISGWSRRRETKKDNAVLRAAVRAAGPGAAHRLADRPIEGEERGDRFSSASRRLLQSERLELREEGFAGTQ